MNFEGLKHRVQRAEHLVEGRIVQATAQRERFKLEWRSAWTPGRIVIAGLAAGFLSGRARPARLLKAISATRWMQLATSVSGLFASLQAAWAAQTAEAAAEGAESAADSAEAAATDAAVATQATAATATGAATDDATPPRSVSDGRRRPDPEWDSEPRPAEAATELSER